MAIIALVSAKGSPGVSTAALACTLTWAGRTILAECDPAGGDILAGYLATLNIPGDHGLLQIAKADLHQQLNTVFWGQLIDLDSPHRRRLVLPGLADLAQAAALRATWPRLATFFIDLERAGYDVIADCGRISLDSPWPVLENAASVLLVLRPTNLRAIVPASPALALLRRRLGHTADAGALGLLLVGDDGDYSHRELEHRLRAPVVARLPDDRRTADALCGAGPFRGSRTLLRHAASIEDAVRAAVACRHTTPPAPAPPPLPVPVRSFVRGVDGGR